MSEQEENTILDACFNRAIELLWSGDQARTCGELMRQLENEFGIKVVADMLRRIDHTLIKNL